MPGWRIATAMTTISGCSSPSADALTEQAELERRAGSTARAPALCDQLLDRYADDREGPLADVVARHLVCRGSVGVHRVARDSRETDLLAFEDELIARCQHPAETELTRRERAMRWMSTTGKPGLDAPDQWASYLEQYNDDKSRAELAGTLLMKTVLLGDQGAAADRRVLLQQITAPFADDDSGRARSVARPARCFTQIP
jgi:hypothetical protein